MPVQFRRTYEMGLHQWIQTKQDELETNIVALDNATGSTVDVSVTSYADDVKERNMVEDGQEAVQVLARSGVLLDEVISELTLTQNAAKAEHVAAFYGPGQ